MQIQITSTQIRKLKIGALILVAAIIILFLVTNMKPETAKLANTLEMGVTELNVRDLDLQRGFYADLVGFDVISETDTEVTLGRGEREIIRLIETKNFNLPKSTDSGLYHTAIVFETRAHLANTISNLIAKSNISFEGTSDHLVSEAFYFHDFEGNGVELYFDKPRSDWQYNPDGSIKMGGIYIDPIEYIEKYGDSSVVKSPAKMGHVHLKVGNIAQAKDFYVNKIGFDITSEMPTALFISVGGYHHHLGMNTWQSLGSGKRGETLGLRTVEIQIPAGDIANLKSRLSSNSIAFSETDSGLNVTDPWGNVIVVSQL